MDTNATVYKGNVFSNPHGFVHPYYITEGEVSGVVVDSVPMVRIHNALFPATDGWRETKAEAMDDVVRELARMSGELMKQIDEIRSEMLHESLTREAAA
jgi:hypothetical protein